MDFPWVLGQWIYSQIDCLIISTRNYQGVMENLFFKELNTEPIIIYKETGLKLNFQVICWL